MADKGGHSPVAIHNNSSTSKSRAFHTRRSTSGDRRGFKSQANHIGLRIGSFTVRGQNVHYKISKALVSNYRTGPHRHVERVLYNSIGHTSVICVRTFFPGWVPVPGGS